jgi:hypothetical protein
MRQSAKIEVFHSPRGGYFVAVGDRYEDGLSSDEALFAVAQALITPDSPPRFLRTEIEHFERSTRIKWDTFRRDIRKPLLLSWSNREERETY